MKKLVLLFISFFANHSFGLRNNIEDYSIKVSAENRNNYVLTGADLNSVIDGEDPELTFLIGSKIQFVINAKGHPFFLKLKAGIGKKNQINGIENNGISVGIITWIPKEPGTYYYQCGKHKNMVGKINII